MWNHHFVCNVFPQPQLAFQQPQPAFHGPKPVFQRPKLASSCFSNLFLVDFSASFFFVCVLLSQNIFRSSLQDCWSDTVFVKLGVFLLRSVFNKLCVPFFDASKCTEGCRVVQCALSLAVGACVFSAMTLSF